MNQFAARRPTPAFVGASWLAVLIGGTAYLVGLYNARMSPSEKGFYLTVLLFGMFAAVAVQKNVRDLGGAAFEDEPGPDHEHSAL